MTVRRLCFHLLAGLIVAAICQTACASSPVWKVTNAEGGTLYLGGSVHALRKSDYPIPTAFDRAFENSARLVFEVDDDKLDSEKLRQSAQYPKGDSLKNHVDPRTYAYVTKFFGLLGVSEATVARYRPWFLTLTLWSPSLQGLSPELGIEDRLTSRAHAHHKPVSGLVTTREHLAVFTGLSERQSEAVLLLTFIPSANHSRPNLIEAWKRGDVDALWHQTAAEFADYPAFGERILEARNRTWLPKIEGYLHSKETYFVVVGAGHMGGPEGLLALLRQRGYKIEQL